MIAASLVLASCLPVAADDEVEVVVFSCDCVGTPPALHPP